MEVPLLKFRKNSVLSLLLAVLLFLGTGLSLVRPVAAEETASSGDSAGMQKLFLYDFDGDGSHPDNTASGIQTSFTDGCATIRGGKQAAYWNIGASVMPASKISSSNLPPAASDAAAAEFRRYAKLTFSWTLLIPEGETETVPADFCLMAYRRRKADGTANSDTYTLPVVSLSAAGKLTTGKDAGGKAIATLTPGTLLNLTCALDIHSGHMDYYVNGKLTTTAEYWDKGWYNACMAGQIVNNATKYEKGKVLTDTDGNPYEYYYNYLVPLCFQLSAAPDKTLILDNISCYGGMPDVAGDTSDFFEEIFPALRTNKITGAEMSLGTDISLRFYARLYGVTDTDTVSMRFVSGGETTEVPEDTSARKTIYEGKTEHVFSYRDIGPQNFARPIDCELLLNGQVVAERKGYSAKEYCDALLAGNPDSTTAALVEALITYASAAARYAGVTDPRQEIVSKLCDFSDTNVFARSGINPNLYESAGIRELEDSPSGNPVFMTKNYKNYATIIYKTAMSGMNPGDRFRFSFRYKCEELAEGRETGAIHIAVTAGGKETSLREVAVVRDGWIEYETELEYKEGWGTDIRIKLDELGRYGGVKYAPTYYPCTDHTAGHTPDESWIPVFLGKAEGTYTFTDKDGNDLTAGTDTFIYKEEADVIVKTAQDGTQTTYYHHATMPDKNAGNWSVLYFDSLAVTRLPASEIPQDTGMSLTQGDVATILSANVIFHDRHTLRFSFRTAEDITDGTVCLNGIAVPASQIIAIGDGRYFVETEALSALEFDRVFTLTVGDASLRYSLNAYVSRMQEDEEIGILARATYAYGQAAKAYRTAHPVSNQH